MTLYRKDIERLKRVQEQAHALRRLNECFRAQIGFPLHDGQKMVVKKIFNEGKTNGFLQCGRNWSKSTLDAYLAVRVALTFANTHNYIILPERKQAYEVYWASGLLEGMIPREYLLDGDDGKNKSELRFLLKNKSFLKLDGSDNHRAMRGYKPDSLFADEYQDWLREAWIAMEPNLLAKKALVLRNGTPPDREGFYTETRQFIINEIKRGNPRYFYMECPTHMNPRFSKEDLDELHRGFVERQEEGIWLREYMAKYVPGGARAIWGTLWARGKFQMRHDELMGIIGRDRSKLRWFTICDPGTTTCFAVLFAAYNPYTAEMYLLDEIYERDRSKTSSSQIWERIKAKEAELYPNHPEMTFFRVADEAAAWFMQEIQYNYREAITPTRKAKQGKEQNVSLAKDMMVHDKLRCSDRLQKFFYEMDNFITKENGDFPDTDDHLIDDFFYLLAESGYSFVEKGHEGLLIEPITGRVDRYGMPRESWEQNVDGIEQYDFGRDYLH